MTRARDLADSAQKANFLDNVTSDLNTSLTNNATAASNASTAAANAVLPAGLILPFGNTSAPTGYLECDGSAVSRTTYAALFAAIGTTWGTGDGSTTFNVPDFRGAFLRGTGSNATHNMANGSDFAGPSVGSFEDDQIQKFAMNHASNAGSFTDSGSGSNGFRFSGGAATPRYGPSFQTVNFASNGFGTPRVGDETRPFNAGVLYCIKT